MNKYTISILSIMLLFGIIILAGFASAGFVKLCLQENQIVKFSLCNPSISDRTCSSTTCQYCVSTSPTGAYCPASLQSCNAIADCTYLGNSTTNTTLPAFNVTVTSPLDGYSVNVSKNISIQFKYTVKPYQNISFCNLVLNNIDSAQNKSRILNSVNTITKVILPGQYIWTINCTDNSGKTETAISRVLKVNSNGQVQLPTISLASPNSGQIFNGSAQINFLYNISSTTNVTSCNLYLNGNFALQNSTLILQSNNAISKLMNQGFYSWFISCNHKSGTSIISSTRSFTILANNNSIPGNSTQTNSTEQIILLNPLSNMEIDQNLLNVTFSFIINNSNYSYYNCNLTVNNDTTQIRVDNSTNSTANITKELLIGDYQWNVLCTNSSHFIQSNIVNFVLSQRATTPPGNTGSSGGGGGGGGGSITPVKKNSTNSTNSAGSGNISISSNESISTNISNQGLNFLTGAAIGAAFKKPYTYAIIFVVLVVVGYSIFVYKKGKKTKLAGKRK